MCSVKTSLIISSVIDSVSYLARQVSPLIWSHLKKRFVNIKAEKKLCNFGLCTSCATFAIDVHLTWEVFSSAGSLNSNRNQRAKRLFTHLPTLHSWLLLLLIAIWWVFCFVNFSPKKLLRFILITFDFNGAKLPDRYRAAIFLRSHTRPQFSPPKKSVAFRYWPACVRIQKLLLILSLSRCFLLQIFSPALLQFLIFALLFGFVFSAQKESKFQLFRVLSRAVDRDVAFDVLASCSPAIGFWDVADMTGGWLESDVDGFVAFLQRDESLDLKKKTKFL